MVTKGNWKVSSIGVARCIFYRGKRTGGRSFVVNKALDIIATAEGDTQEEAEANAKLIAAAVNGCKAANEFHPLAVAENIEGLVMACSHLIDGWNATVHEEIAQALAKVIEEKC